MNEGLPSSPQIFHHLLSSSSTISSCKCYDSHFNPQTFFWASHHLLGLVILHTFIQHSLWITSFKIICTFLPKTSGQLPLPLRKTHFMQSHLCLNCNKSASKGTCSVSRLLAPSFSVYRDSRYTRCWWVKEKTMKQWSIIYPRRSKHTVNSGPRIPSDLCLPQSFP